MGDYACECVKERERGPSALDEGREVRVIVCSVADDDSVNGLLEDGAALHLVKVVIRIWRLAVEK